MRNEDTDTAETGDEGVGKRRRSQPRRLTDESVKAARLPADQRQVDIYDSVCNGLVLRVGANAKTWAFHYRFAGTFKKLTLGNALSMKLVDARRKAQELGERVRAGADPMAAVENAPVTFAELADAFLEQSTRDSKEADRAMLRLHVIPTLGNKRLLALTGPDFARLKESIIKTAKVNEIETAKRLRREPRPRAGERIADRTIGVCKSILRWGVPLGYVTTDMTMGIRRSTKSTDGRKRVLSDDEIVAFLEKLPEIFPDEQRQLLIRLILLFGCRKGELMGARLSEFTLTGADPRWLQPKDRVKNRHDHVVPLSPAAIVLINRAIEIVHATVGIVRANEYLFPSPETGEPFQPTAVHKVLQQAFRPGSVRVRNDETGLYTSKPRDAILICEPFTVHDLRRTAATGMARLGISTEIIGKALNHRSADQSVTGLIYNVHDFAMEKRAALTKWAEHVARLEEAAGR